MFRIFRNVRRQLMRGNNTTRYLGYALGEIVLVVFGILIALWISNWNEQQKVREFEREMLAQVRSNLVMDRDNLSGIITNARRAIRSSNKILALEPNSTPPDSLKYWLGEIAQFDRFQPLTNAYEVLKSKGLDQVSNKELRLLLGTYYDNVVYAIRDANEDLKYTFMIDWLPVMKEGIVDFKFRHYLVLEDMQEFTEPGELRNILMMNIDNYQGSLNYMENGLDLIDKINGTIDVEIGTE